MGESESALLRAAALHLDRYRAVIEAEVLRQMVRGDPPPYARGEIVRRFRSFCRLASIDLAAARPSFDGLGGMPSDGLEKAIAQAVEVACACDAPPELQRALRDLEARFRAGIRRVLQPAPEREPSHANRRRVPNAGKRVRSAIDRIPDAYLALCLDTGRIFDVNPACEALFGAESAWLLERPLVELVSPAQRAAFGELEARLDAGEDCAPLELRLARPAGDEVRVHIAVASHTIGPRRLAIFTVREPCDPRALALTPPESSARVGSAPAATPALDSRNPAPATRA